MAMERVPYLVGGGFEHSAEVMRAALAAATSGAEGVLGGGDFKVGPTAVPGTNIAIAPGNGLVRNSYVGGGAQTYAVRAPSQTELPIVATGSAGSRTDLVVARIDDPTYQGGAFDPATFEAARFEVIRGVPANTASVAGLGLSYPALALARITLPASTGTVTASMITDLRRVALPRRERRLVTIYPAGNYSNGTAHKAGAVYSSWPIRPEERPSLLVPSWATQLQIVVHISGCYYVKGTSTDSVIGLRTGFGSEGSQNGIAIETDTGRHHYSVVGTHFVEEHRRGTSQLVNIQAMQTRGDGTFWADYQTSVAVDIEFSEVA
jgi:hypothetical protein